MKEDYKSIGGIPLSLYSALLCQPGVCLFWRLKFFFAISLCHCVSLVTRSKRKRLSPFLCIYCFFLVYFWRFGCVRFHPSCHFQYIELHRTRDADDLMLEGPTEAVGQADQPLLIMPRLHRVHKQRTPGESVRCRVLSCEL